MSINSHDRKLRFTPEEQMRGAERMAEAARKGGKELLRELQSHVVHPGQTPERSKKRPKT